MNKKHSILWFVLFTVALSFGAYLLPLPAEQKALLVPVILVFIPTLVSVPLAFLTEGQDGMRQLFSSVRGMWMWILIGAGIGAFLRIAVLVAGLAFGTSI